MSMNKANKRQPPAIDMRETIAVVESRCRGDGEDTLLGFSAVVVGASEAGMVDVVDSVGASVITGGRKDKVDVAETD